MTPRDQSAGADLVEHLSGLAERTLTSLLGPVRTVALLDFTDTPNVGDSAIWLGQTRFLRRRGITIAEASDRGFYSPTRIAALASAPILLTGGGTLGDLWPEHQHFRERVVSDFPDRKIIQLPQSVHFREAANLERARKVFDSHPDLTLLVRDEQSLAIASSVFRATTLLCPDAALLLGPLPRPGPARVDVLWLRRTDQESRESPAPLRASHEVHVTDWLDEPFSVTQRALATLRRQISRHPRRFARLHRLLPTMYGRVARERLARGTRLLSSGRVVITDRLHAHILSVMLGIPNVVTDNSYGKVSAFMRTWTAAAPSVRLAESLATALATALDLAREGKKADGQSVRPIDR